MKIYSLKLVQDTCVCEVDGRQNALSSPEESASFFRPLFAEYPGQEQVRIVLLNVRNKSIGTHLVTVGTATSSPAHPREIFRAAIVAGATSIICSHNHPSGDPSPSAADHNITRQLREAARVIGIELLDHIIIGEADADPNGAGFYSFRKAGLL